MNAATRDASPAETLDPWDEYRRSGSHQAFEAVMQQWLPLVVATARRRTGDQPALAEDVAQVVFTDLARRGRELRVEKLPGWLHRHAGFTAAKMVRGERRRQARERVAAGHDSRSTADATRFAALDEALLGIPEADRHVLLLRFAAGLDHEEVGRRLSISRSAAQKRSERALERLRRAYRGELSPPLLASLLAPAALGTAALSKRIARDALAPSAASASLVAPWLGSLLGISCASLVAAIPLRGAWQDLRESRPPATTVSAQIPAAAPRTPVRNSPRDPAGSVASLLAIADQYGLGSAGQNRAVALVGVLPESTLAEVIARLDRELPASLRGSDWQRAVARELAAHWRPGRVPDDLVAIWSHLPADPAVHKSLFLACAAADLDATRALMDDFPRASRLRPAAEPELRLLQEALLCHLSTHDPGAAALLYQELPPLGAHESRPPGHQDLWNTLTRHPELRPAYWQALGKMSGPRQASLHGQLSRLASEDELARFEAAIGDPQLATRIRVWRASANGGWSSLFRQLPPHAAADPALLDAGELAAGPAARAAWLARTGEPAGGPEFDPLRRSFIRKSLGESEPGTLLELAGRIRDPDQRLHALVGIVPKLPDPEAWLRENFSPQEAAQFRQILERPYLTP